MEEKEIMTARTELIPPLKIAGQWLMLFPY